MNRFVKVLSVLGTAFLLQSFTPHVESSSTTVYICVTGKVYHSSKSCRGLDNAKHPIKAVSIEEAQKTRRACKICYKWCL